MNTKEKVMVRKVAKTVVATGLAVLMVWVGMVLNSLSPKASPTTVAIVAFLTILLGLVFIMVQTIEDAAKGEGREQS